MRRGVGGVEPGDFGACGGEDGQERNDRVKAAEAPRRMVARPDVGYLVTEHGVEFGWL